MNRIYAALVVLAATFVFTSAPAEASDAYPCGNAHHVAWSSGSVQGCPLSSPLSNGWVPVYRSPVSHAKGAALPGPAGWLHGTTGQSFVCQQRFAGAEYYHPKGWRNNWWAYTKSDDGHWGWTPEVFFHGGGNDEADAGLTSCGGNGPNPTQPTPTPPVTPNPTPKPKPKPKKHKRKHHRKTHKPARVHCTAYTIYGVRGSGEGYAGPYNMGDTVGPTAQQAKATLGGHSVRLYSIPYPAAPVSDLVKAGGNAFFRSMAYGEILLNNAITKTIRSCPRSKIGVIGYSQGAGVASQALRRLPTSYFRHVRVAALFADTYSVGQSKFSMNFDYFNPNLTAPYKRQGHGIFGARKLPGALKNALDICFGNDIVCDASSSDSDKLFQAFVSSEHTHYKDWSPGFAPTIPYLAGIIFARMIAR